MEAENTKAPTLAEFQEVLSQGRYAIRDVDTLKGVLCDAFILYDVTEGRGRLSELLTLGEKKADPEPSHRQDNSGRRSRAMPQLADPHGRDRRSAQAE
jgi:hypothetical protein